MHLVYAQEAENSCGIACVMMVTFKINKLKLGAQAVYAEKEIYTKYSAASGANYDGSAYTYTNHLATVLNTLGIGTWTQEFTNDVSSAIINSVGTDIVGAGQVFNSIRRGYPIIVLVGWNAGGAHFVVVDTVNNFLGSTYASVCDPWDGDVHITPIEAGQPFVYEGAASPFSWDLGGTRHDYSQSQPGAANGWIVKRL
jgi:hypothetical protein